MQAWTLIDTADHRRDRHGERRIENMLDWVNATAAVQGVGDTLDQWRHRPNPNPRCLQPPADWWRTPLDTGLPLPAACPDHAGVPGGRADCLLAQSRRALTLGHVAPGMLRTRLRDYLDHPDAAVDDWWTLTAAGRDHYTAGGDALRRIGASYARVGDLEADATHIRVRSQRVAVPAACRPALQRLRTSRRLAGCLGSESLGGLFDQAALGEPMHRRP